MPKYRKEWTTMEVSVHKSVRTAASGVIHGFQSIEEKKGWGVVGGLNIERRYAIVLYGMSQKSFVDQLLLLLALLSVDNKWLRGWPLEAIKQKRIKIQFS